MTYEQALTELKDSIQGSGYQCHIETYKTAIKALEKQIPKKPAEFHTTQIKEIFYGLCGCGEHINDDEKYCSNCGQAIDWHHN